MAAPMETLAQAAQRLRDIWGLGEGPQVEDALYAYGTKAQSAATTFDAPSWSHVLQAYHAARIDDQFVPPLVRVDGAGRPLGIVKEGDTVLYFDFRTDRAKPLTAAFLDIPFGGQVGGLSDAARARRPKVTMLTMTHYDDNFNQSAELREAFNPAAPLSETYSEVAGKAGIRQLVVAETEKWRAVTWFKDGRRNLGYSKQGTDGIVQTDVHPELPITVKVVQSRKVAAHIQAPQMRAKEIADVLLEGIAEGYPDIFVNFANSDMVGHAMTDVKDFPGVVDAILELDTQLGRVVPAALKEGYVVIISADHGNAEAMVHGDGKANPAHTTNKVPFIVLGLGPEEKCSLREDATIGALAPTVLQLRGLPQPASWDGSSALVGPVTPRKDRRIFKIILDGYGIHPDKKHNAMAAAAERKGAELHMDAWMHGKDGAVACPVEASGERCGYPKGEAGTTEFGHVLFDAGRMVHSDVSLIDHALETGAFAKNAVLAGALDDAKARGSTVHIMGVLSDGMVHSSLKHLEGIIELAAARGLRGAQLSVHVITDGRDVPGDSSPKYVAWLEALLQRCGVGEINSVWGRGWGKDRDNRLPRAPALARWKRIEAAFRSLVEGTAAVHIRLP